MVNGCARPGRPPGGPEDRIPPMVVSTWPDTFAVIEPTRDPIEIRFNERISERPTQGTLDDAVLVSPETGEIRVDHSRAGLEIEVLGGLRSDLVYRVRVLPTIKDLFNNPMEGPFELVFSTGAEFQHNVIAGVIRDRITADPVPNVRVAATELGAGEPPVYVTKTDSAGIYLLRYLPPASYAVSVFEDLNRNREPDFNELQGETMGEVGQEPAATDTIIREVQLLRPDTLPARLVQAQAVDSVTLEASFDDFLPTEFPLVQTTATLTRDSVTEAGDTLTLGPEAGLPAVESLLWERELEAMRARKDSIRAADSLAAVADSLRATAESLRNTLVRLSQAGDSVAYDSVQAVLEIVEERLAPPEEEEEEAAEGRRRASEQELMEAFLPKQSFFILLSEPIVAGRAYKLTVSGVMNVNNLGGGGGETTVTWEPPEPQEGAGGTLPDSGAALPDTGAAPPDTGLVHPDTSGAPPDTGAAPPDTTGAPPDTGSVASAGDEPRPASGHAVLALIRHLRDGRGRFPHIPSGRRE